MCNLINWTCVTGLSRNMHLIILIGFITLNCGSHVISVSGDLPCDFLDSVNISGGEFRSNRTIVYQDLKFPLGQYAKINYTVDNRMKRLTVAPYLRGCVCNREPCIRMCCPFGSIQVKSRQCQTNDVAQSIEVFSDKDHDKKLRNMEPVRKFTFVDGYPCKRMHFIDAEYKILEVCHFYQ